MLEGGEDVRSSGRKELVGRVATGRHSDRHCTGLLGGVDVAGCVADDEDLVWGEIVVQARGFGDGEARELTAIGGVRAVGAEKKEPVEVCGHELRTDVAPYRYSSRFNCCL